MTPTTVTTIPKPPPTPHPSRDHADAWAAARLDEVRRLTDRVVGDGHHDARWRSAAALRLAGLVLDGTVAVPAAVVRRLDAALPTLLRSVDPAAAAPLTALCAVLGDRLSKDVCPPLQDLTRRAVPPVAVAAHVASLLVEASSRPRSMSRT